MIAIKDMGMPKNCASCVMRVGKCKERIYMENRPDRCPLIEINTDWDTISRAEAIETVKFECGEWKGLAQTIVNGIKKLPSAQSEIIRCKDCKHIKKWRSEESAKKFGQIYECARNVLDCPKPEDFCSHAERRTDDSISD